MSRALPRDAGARGVPYRRGAVMGLTMAEAFVLIAFALLLLLGLWSVARDEAEARLAPLRDLSPAEVGAADRLAASGRIEALDRLVTEGALPGDGATPEGEVWRLVDRDAEARLLDGVERLPPAMRAGLADLVEIEDPALLARALDAAALALALPPAEGAADPLAGIGARLGAARAERAALVTDLRGTLGATVSEVGGTIEADGSIVLPDAVLFEQGSARITPVMADFLARACGPWLAVLQGAEAPVARAQIEGHASSEWRAGSGPDEAYLNNLALSQARSQSVLDGCLRQVADPSLRAWAQRHLVAVGYSSARPVMAGEAEDRERSRRVVFGVGLDDEGLLREVEGDVAAGLGSR